jgi:DNA-binding NarL/FixJ family response regulator
MILVSQTVLVVDDHPSFRTTARRLLQAEGFDVVGEAENGAEAVRKAGELHPDFVLLDVQLPDLNGFEVANVLCRNGSSPMVVLVSSRDATDYGELIAGCGARGFIPKAELSGASIRALLL